MGERKDERTRASFSAAKHLDNNTLIGFVDIAAPVNMEAKNGVDQNLHAFILRLRVLKLKSSPACSSLDVSAASPDFRLSHAAAA